MKKGVVLVIVWGMALVLCFLAMGAIYLMRNQAFVSEHRIRRLMGYYTAKHKAKGLRRRLERGPREKTEQGITRDGWIP